MTIAGIRAAYRWALGLAILAAVGDNLISKWNVPSFRAANFFSYFTIDSNLLAAATCIWAAVVLGRSSRRLDAWRGAATVYLFITGVVFAVLLAHENLGLTLPWVNTTLHRVAPLVLVLDWLTDPPVRRTTFRQAASWILLANVWLVYTLLRGSLVNWYPYPFLDPRKPDGYTRVAGYVAGINLFAAAGVAVLAWAAAVLSRRRGAGTTQGSTRATHAQNA